MIPAWKPLSSILLVACISLPSGALCADDSATFRRDNEGFRRFAVPFLKRYCMSCHGPDDDQGEFRVDRDLSTDFLDLATKGKWGEVVNVLNSHEMPPEDERQPKPNEVSRVVDWITEQMVQAELVRRDTTIVLRRMNRDEYRNTIRDLVGVDYETKHFPQDPPAGGFDNNGGALTISPLHLELYYDSAREIFDKAFVTGQQPPAIKWRIEPESGDSDRNRVTHDGQRIIVNGGKNRVEGNFVAIHHNSWDRTITFRDFALKDPGEYIIRIRAGGRVPTRDQVVTGAKHYLEERIKDLRTKKPREAEHRAKRLEQELDHFRQDRMYDYGPARIKVRVNLGGQPRVVAELDIDATVEEPKPYEIRANFTTQTAGVKIVYAYDIPKELENFWMQTGDKFPRPEVWIDWIELEGPIYPQWPPASHQQLLLGSEEPRADERAFARDVLDSFMRRAYRRPVAATEVEQKLTFFDQARPDADSFIEAIKVPLTATLVSPHFLYLAEPEPRGTAAGSSSGTPPSLPTPPRTFTDTRGRKLTASVVAIEGDKVRIKRRDNKQFTVPMAIFVQADRDFLALLANGGGGRSANQPTSAARRLDNHELASRLSYFLWSSMPDDELFRLADQGQLTNESVLVAQVDRLLADPKSEAFVANFAGQWLGLREVGANPPAADLYRRYDRHLETSMVDESLAFFREILHNDLSVMNFVKSPFVVVNERMARFYGISDVRGDQFRRVSVPTGVHRGGVVTQASVLSITSNGTRTSPVKRGTWVMKNVLGVDPGLPVANAGEIAPKVPGLDKATVRQRLEIHRELPQCARCHNKIDPLGFALENFDASGNWRDQEGFGYKGRVNRNDPVIDASSKLLDGTEIDGVDDLRDALSDQEDLFLTCLSQKLFTYALGRELGIADQVHVKAAVGRVKASKYTMRSLIQFVVQSELFRSK